jgi:hypothetical protein
MANFLPTRITSDGRIAVVVADPSQLMLIDEMSLLLGQRIRRSGWDARPHQ